MSDRTPSTNFPFLEAEMWDQFSFRFPISQSMRQESVPSVVISDCSNAVFSSSAQPSPGMEWFVPTTRMRERALSVPQGGQARTGVAPESRHSLNTSPILSINDQFPYINRWISAIAEPNQAGTQNGPNGLANVGQNDTRESGGSSPNVRSAIDPFSRNIEVAAPRLCPKLIDRFANINLKRFTILKNNRIEHAKLLCRQSGSPGVALRAAASPKLATVTRRSGRPAVFRIPSPSDKEPNFTNLSPQAGKSAIKMARFPAGVPLPPTSVLPAQFECPYCFETKEFSKPSDWTKHTHEDILPFTCTFQDCISSPSFKRKAEWKRHEDECHRQYEGWKCNLPQCVYKCYRKENFACHMRREHGVTAELNPEKFKQMVTCCYFTNDEIKPQDEPCQFCGKIFLDWDKLKDHLAEHLLGIALSVFKMLHTTVVDENSEILPLSPIPTGKSHGVANVDSSRIGSKFNTSPSQPGSTSLFGSPRVDLPQNNMNDPTLFGNEAQFIGFPNPIMAASMTESQQTVRPTEFNPGNAISTEERSTLIDISELVNFQEPSQSVRTSLNDSVGLERTLFNEENLYAGNFNLGNPPTDLMQLLETGSVGLQAPAFGQPALTELYSPNFDPRSAFGFSEGAMRAVTNQTSPASQVLQTPEVANNDWMVGGPAENVTFVPGFGQQTPQEAFIGSEMNAEFTFYLNAGSKRQLDEM